MLVHTHTHTKHAKTIHVMHFVRTHTLIKHIVLFLCAMIFVHFGTSVHAVRVAFVSFRRYFFISYFYVEHPFRSHAFVDIPFYACVAHFDIVMGSSLWVFYLFVRFPDTR